MKKLVQAIYEHHTSRPGFKHSYEDIEKWLQAYECFVNLTEAVDKFNEKNDLFDWRDIPEYEGLYQMNREGLVRRNGKVLSINTNGKYRRASLFKNGKKQIISINKYVKMIFGNEYNDFSKWGIFVSIDGFDKKYYVSNLGFIKNKDRMLSSYMNTNGELMIQLYKDGNKAQYKVKNLVAASLSPVDFDLQTVHIRDGNEYNCSINNLLILENHYIASDKFPGNCIFFNKVENHWCYFEGEQAIEVKGFRSSEEAYESLSKVK